MGYKELTAELQREAEEKIAEMWRHAGERVSRAREETAAEMEGLRKASAGKQTAAEEEATRDILSVAERQVLETRLAGLQELSGRLHEMAVSQLAVLRMHRYEELFAALVWELPEFPWQTVKVNAADMELARRHFPAAEIAAGEGICGGMEVFSEDGRICVVNTLEKRLERGWPDLLPDLIAAVYREIGRNVFAED